MPISILTVVKLVVYVNALLLAAYLVGQISLSDGESSSPTTMLRQLAAEGSERCGGSVCGEDYVCDRVGSRPYCRFSSGQRRRPVGGRSGGGRPSGEPSVRGSPVTALSYNYYQPTFMCTRRALKGGASLELSYQCGGYYNNYPAPPPPVYTPVYTPPVYTPVYTPPVYTGGGGV